MAKLTDDEIDLLQEQYDCYGDCDAPRIHDLARAVEAAVLAKVPAAHLRERAQLEQEWCDLRQLKEAAKAACPSAVVEAPADQRARDVQFWMAEAVAWKELLWAVARALNCLPSTFSDGNAHVFKQAEKLTANASRLREALERIAGTSARYDTVPGLERPTEFAIASHYWHTIGSMRDIAAKALAESATTGKEPG